MSVEKLLDKCGKFFDENNYDEVIKTCNKILKIDLNNEAALLYKARSLNLLGEHEKALTLLNNAIRLYPNHHFFWQKAEVLMHKKDYGRAIRCFEEAFEKGVDDEIALGFMKSHYQTCFSLKTDQLIEKEKYVDAWKCYMRELEIKSDDLKGPEAIARFMKYVRDYTSRVKKRSYYVKISSNDAKLKLIRFLKENGFESENESGLIFLIDVVDKTYNAVSVDEIGCDDIISESKFLDKVNYYPRGKIEYKKIYGEDGRLLYEGNTLYNAPYGFGIAYFADGNIYREGIFDIKGIVQGKEYYPSGQLRFAGQWSLTYGYGPNAPYNGNAYDEDGKLIYSGKFKIKKGGVGWPMIQKPKGFPHEQKQRPKIKYYSGFGK